MKSIPPSTSFDRIRISGRTRIGGGVRLLVAVLLVVPLAACATKGDIRDLQGEVRSLAERQEALMREIQADQREQSDSLQVLASRFGEHRTQLSRTLRDMEDSLLRVGELVGVSQQELAALRDQMDRRPMPATQPGAGGLDVGGEAQEIYDDAMTQYRRGSTTSARLGLEEVVERFPNHQLTPSARYFLADIMVQNDELEEAIDAFLEILEYHPEADRAASALYRVGLIYRELGDDAEARSYLERVVNTWPDSAAADMAQRVLDEMG